MTRKPSTKPTGIKNRREPIMATIYQPAKGQSCIRTAENHVQKAVVRDLEKQYGRRLTKAERKRAKKLAAEILAQARQREQRVQPPTPSESLIHRPGPLLVDPEGRAIA